MFDWGAFWLAGLICFPVTLACVRVFYEGYNDARNGKDQEARGRGEGGMIIGLGGPLGLWCGPIIAGVLVAETPANWGVLAFLCSMLGHCLMPFGILGLVFVGSLFRYVLLGSDK